MKVQVPVETYRELEELAKKHDLSVGDLIAKLLKLEVKSLRGW
jgi:predicted DNA-binding ribbon-helix-helix protein